MKPFALWSRVHVSSIWLAVISIFALFFQGVVQAAPVPTKEPIQTLKTPSSVVPLSLESIMGLDLEWNPDRPSPFVKKNDHFELKVDIQSANSVQFPLHLDADNPILIKTRHGEVKQYLVSKAKYTAHLTGRYLVYVGEKNAVLYRYDTDTKSLREFVYSPNRDSISQKGDVIQWRFDDADLYLKPDGRVAVQKTVDIKSDVRKVSNNHMAERISRFLAKRYGKNGPQGPQTRTLFIIPRPVYLDDQGNKYGGNINYRLDQHVLTLQMQALDKLRFPLWADPTFTADNDASVILDGQSTGDQFGWHVASAGDFNGDGVDDLIVSASGDPHLSVPNTSKNTAYVFFGSSPVSIVGGVSEDDANVILEGLSISDYFGAAVGSAGDFNGDGIDDLIIGAPYDDNNGRNNSGSAFIFFGRTNITSQLFLETDTDADVILNGRAANDLFGRSVATAGDFNGDGKDDVVVGAPGNDTNGAEAGSAYLFLGRSVSGQLTLEADTQSDLTIEGQGNPFNFFGWSVASAGDFDGDGLDDVIVGADGDCCGAHVYPGRAYIFFGQSLSGSLTLNANTGANVILDQPDFDEFGWAVSLAGDFDGDGLDDVIVGAPIEGTNGFESGRAYLFLGRSVGSQVVLDVDTQADIVFEGNSPDDFFGTSVAGIGDFNGDGLSDVLVGADGDDTSGIAAGSVYLFFGRSLSTQLILQTNDADVTLNGTDFEDWFGWSAASAGDFNGDGLGDIVVGAWGDDNGQTDSGSAYIFLSSDLGFTPPPVDTTPPVITLNGNNPETVEAGAIYVDPGATALDDVDGDLTSGIVTTGLPINTSTPFSFTVSYSVTDAAGNSATATRTVNVVDTTPPHIHPPGDITIEATGSLTPVDLGFASALDFVDGPVTVTPDQTGPFNVGTHTITWTASDFSGNTSTATQTVTVTDTTAPVITLNGPNPATLQVGFSLVDQGATAWDVVDGDLTNSIVVTGLPVDSSTPNTSFDVIYSVIDAAGNTATATRTVNVVDTIPPVITAPADITVNTDPGQATAVVTFPSATATDNSGVAPTVTQTGGPVSGSAFPIGTTTITWTATDSSGNTASASMTVTVVDNEIEDTFAPEFDVTQTTDTLWPPNHKMVLAAVVSNITDNVDPDPDVSVVVTSNQPQNGSGDGNTESDWEVLRQSGDTWVVSLRAERSGNSEPRIYTVTISVSDDSGNVRTQALTVTVPHDKRKRK